MEINIVIISANIIHILICFFNDKYAWAHTHKLHTVHNSFIPIICVRVKWIGISTCWFASPISSTPGKTVEGLRWRPNKFPPMDLTGNRPICEI